MNELSLILGILLLLAGLIEGLWTSIWVDGTSAPITARVTTWIWKLFRLVIPTRKHKLLSLAGPVILATTVFMWIFFIWLGWTLIFYSNQSSLYIPNNPFEPGFADVSWYVAYVMFTVGNGDFLPAEGVWQILSGLVAFTGMAMVTLSITYILQVISAVNNKRAFSSEVTGIGKTAEAFVIKQWTGDDFGAIELQLNSLSSQLTKLNEQHLSFPILHYYHAARVEKSMDVAVAILDDALHIIKFGIEKKNSPPETIVSSARQSVDSFLTTIHMAFIKPAKDAPRLPQLKKVKDEGVPLLEEKDFEQKIQKEEKRRKLLLGLINNGSWRWPEENTYNG